MYSFAILLLRFLIHRSLLQIYDCLRIPTTHELLDWRYLSGIIDGEGACNHGSIAIGQSKEANPDVYKSIEEVLYRLRIPYKVCKVNPNDTHILRNKEIRRGLGESFVLGGGREVKADILRYGKPAKAHRILKTIWNEPCKPIKRQDKVVSIKHLGKGVVHAIGTTSGNYVAYGYATKNTQYLNRPRTAADVVFSIIYINQHSALSEYPKSLNYRTYVDVSSWNDKKNLARSVVITVGRCSRNHYWIARCDVGRYNPTEVIERMGAHAKQFQSKVLVEEYQYQKSLRFFAKKSMEDGTIEPFLVEAIPYEAQKNAKEMRIRGLEGYVKNGMLHTLTNMHDVIEEFEDYPYGATKDILDMLGYAVKYTPISTTTAEGTYNDPFSLESIISDLKSRKDDEIPVFADPLSSGDDCSYDKFVI